MIISDPRYANALLTFRTTHLTVQSTPDRRDPFASANFSTNPTRRRETSHEHGGDAPGAIGTNCVSHNIVEATVDA
jgi:hypothetical protein